MKILVVEDDLINRKIMLHLLTSYGDCDSAVDGQEAVLAFKRAFAERSPYKLIFMDIMMPVMDGQEALRQIRDFEEQQDIYAPGPEAAKVIMTTALDGLDDAREAFSSMADGYLVKPISLDKLDQQIEELQRLYGIRD